MNKMNYEQTQQTLVQLTKSSPAYICIDQLPSMLKKLAKTEFDILFNLNPSKQYEFKQANKLTLINHENNITHNTEKPKRWTHVMETTFNLDADSCSKSSYIKQIPNELKPFCDYVKRFGSFNQVVVTWLNNGNDYIMFRSDYFYNMTENTYTLILFLFKNLFETRVFSIKSKHFEANDDILNERVNIEIGHGCFISMCGDIQQKFMYGIPEMQQKSECIVITFRNNKVN